MIRVFSYTITDREQGSTIEQFLKNLGYSRQVLIHLKKTPSSVLVNEEWVYLRYCLQKGDHLQIKVIELTSSANIVPIEMDLNIVYEDEDILIINKPADTPIHPSQGNYENTLANGVAYYFQKQNIPYVYRCITRLDRDTTGLLLLAKNMVSACILSNMMVARKIQRTYLAICKGNVLDHGVIDAPIGRVEGSTIERKIDTLHGERAVTNYWCLKQKDGYSLVQLKLETGRTHQIRVHMRHLGYPLIGDFVYNPDYSLIHRQALHSYTLDFVHPITKKAMHFTSKLPDDMLYIV